MLNSNNKSLILAFICVGILSVVLFNCRMLDRGDIDQIIQCMQSIRDAEIKFERERRRFGSLDELVDAKLIESDLRDKEYNGFILNLNATQYHYVLTAVRVKREDGASSDERLSLYLDESGIIRASLRLDEIANSNSSPISPK